jgi:hypothetical protein
MKNALKIIFSFEFLLGWFQWTLSACRYRPRRRGEGEGWHSAHARRHNWRAWSVAMCHVLIGSCFQFEFKTSRLNWKTSRFYHWAPKNSNFVLHHPINIHYGLSSSHYHTNLFSLSWHTHTMASSSSSDIDDQIVMTLLDIMEKVMNILTPSRMIVCIDSGTTVW